MLKHEIELGRGWGVVPLHNFQETIGPGKMMSWQ